MSEKSTRKALKEKFFVQVQDPDNKTPTFIDASSSLGRPVKFTKPLATAALRVTNDAVFFSFLKLSKKQCETFVSRPLAMPPGPLARLERALDRLDVELSPTSLYTIVGEQAYVFDMKKDGNGMLTIESADDTEPIIELPRVPLGVTIFLPGPKDRTIVAAWSGFLATRPGSPETVARAVGAAINHMTGLAAFQVVSGITKVKIPAPPGKFTLAGSSHKMGDSVKVVMPVRLWPATGNELVAEGKVEVEVDLDTANATTTRLLIHLRPDTKIEPYFEDYQVVFDRLVHDEIVKSYGIDEIEDLVVDITLGDLASGQIERLREATVGLIPGIQLNPQMGLLNKDQVAAS